MKNMRLLKSVSTSMGKNKIAKTFEIINRIIIDLGRIIAKPFRSQRHPFCILHADFQKKKEARRK